MANPAGVPASAWTDGAGNYYDDAASTLYTVASNGTVTSRPYTAYEIQLAQQRQQKQQLLDQAKAAVAANNTDISNNDAWLAANPGAAAVTQALVQQSTRQARQLNALIRLTIEDFTSSS